MRYIDIERSKRERHRGTLRNGSSPEVFTNRAEKRLRSGHIKPFTFIPSPFTLVKFFDILEEVRKNKSRQQ